MAMQKVHSTAAELRHDIDRGRTGDNVDWLAAAPLGTDEEAAGTPLAGEAISAARQLGRSAAGSAPQRGLGAAWLLLGYSAAFGAGIAGWIVLQHSL
ncbi:MAG: hypothetical protein IT536_09195 [Hyphomicrobiales bacterium]|nr:hypothetical protein [Hyphomicrobiales bacterium]